MRLSLFLLFFVTTHLHAYTYNMSDITVDGQFSSQSQRAVQNSRSEQLRSQRAQLEEQNERMIQQKIEDFRYQQELQLMKQMQAVMDQTMEALNNISP